MTIPVLPNVNTQLIDTPIFNAQVPEEGPKAIPLILPFNTLGVQKFQINVLLMMSQKFMTMIQGVFIDNSQSANDLLLVPDVINQQFRCPPKSQMYSPLLVPKNANITASSTGNTDLQVIFYNVPVPAFVWPTLNGFAP